MDVYNLLFYVKWNICADSIVNKSTFFFFFLISIEYELYKAQWIMNTSKHRLNKQNNTKEPFSKNKCLAKHFEYAYKLTINI